MAEALKLYVAFAVDSAGVARATYELECLSDDEAKQRSEAYLEAHEISSFGPTIARLKRR
jgi:hypothetical protein